MSSRLRRTLLKLYPRRIRNRYGDELLDLQDELRAQDDVSRTRLIRDMLAGALLVRPARRAYLVIGAVLVIGGLATAGTIIGGRGTDSPARTSHPQAQLNRTWILPGIRSAVALSPYLLTCWVADGSSCSLTPCTEFTGRSSSEGAVAYSSASAAPRRPTRAGTRCTAYPHVQPQRPVFVDG
jgi:hypothetical protein